MRIGAFQVKEPLPELNEPYVFAILHPWIDVNNVGTMVLRELETQFEAKELARLANLVTSSILPVIAQLFILKRVFGKYPFLI